MKTIEKAMEASSVTEESATEKSIAGLVLGVSGSNDPGAVSTAFGSKVFVRASEARVIVELGAHTMVDRALGVGIGVASVQSQLVTLLDLDPKEPSSSKAGEPTSHRFRTSDRAQEVRLGVLCEMESGEGVLLLGGRVLATGLFQATETGDAIEHDSGAVPILSVTQLYRKVEMRVWESRALLQDARPPASRRSEGRTP